MGCSQCGLTLELRSGFARSGVFIGDENVTRSPTLATPPAVTSKRKKTEPTVEN